MSLRERGGIWHYRFEYRKREHSGSTGLAATRQNTAAAKEIEARELAKLRLQQPTQRSRRITIDLAAGQFAEWCKAVQYRSKPNSAHRVLSSFASAVEFFSGRLVDEITPGDLESYKLWRLETHRVKEITLRHDLDALSVFFGRFAWKFGWCTSNPVLHVDRPSDVNAVRIYVIPPDEEQRYFDAARAQSESLYDLGRLMLNQGCRPEELLALTVDAVDLNARTVTIRGGKTRAARRTLDLTEESLEILRRRIKGESKWVFSSPRRPGRHIVTLQNSHDQACRNAGVSFCLYDCRHTFATRMCESGVDIVTLASILGHSGLRMVTRYVHPQAHQKREAMRKYESWLKAGASTKPKNATAKNRTARRTRKGETPK